MFINTYPSASFSSTLFLLSHLPPPSLLLFFFSLFSFLFHFLSLFPFIFPSPSSLLRICAKVRTILFLPFPLSTLLPRYSILHLFLLPSLLFFCRSPVLLSEKYSSSFSAPSTISASITEQYLYKSRSMRSCQNSSGRQSGEAHTLF